MFYKCKSCGSSNLNLENTWTYHNVYSCTDCKHYNCFNIDDCCYKQSLVVTVECHSFEPDRLYYQCINCGGANKSKPLKFKEYSEKIRFEFNQEHFKEWKLKRSNESNLIFENIKWINYYNTNHYKYHQYLESEVWKEKRNKVLKRDNYICQICKNSPAQEVHHLTYMNVYNEKLDDLQALCKKCHNDVHIKNPLLARIIK